MPNSKIHKPLTVKVGGQQGSPSRYTVLTVSRSTGGGRVDQATVAVERAPNLYIANSEARPVENGQTLEVFHGGTRIFWGIVEDAGFSWGDAPDAKTIIASIQPWAFGPPIAHATYLEVRAQNYLGETADRIRVDDPIVFNGFPTRGDDPQRWLTRRGLSFVGNKTTDPGWLGLTREGKNTNGRTALLIPLEAVQTSQGRERYLRAFSPRARLMASGAEPKIKPTSSFEWTLRDAVRYVCVHGNDEKFIRNPAKYDFIPAIVLPRTELPPGRYLPDYLDLLLRPYGFDWYVDTGDGQKKPASTGGTSGAAAVAGLVAGGAAAIGGLVSGGQAAIGGLVSSGQAAIAGLGGKPSASAGATAGADAPKIEFTKWGNGPEVSAKYAKLGADADFNTTNVANVDINFSISQSINKVHVKGGRVLLEGTFELYRVGLDKFVLNEGGDYEQSPFAQYHTAADQENPIGDNEVVAPQAADLAPKAAFGLFGQSGFVRMLQRARRFLPTITVVGPLTEPGSATPIIDTRPIGPNGGYDIEILDLGQENKAAGEETWINIDHVDDPMFRNVRVLEDECGILFDRGSTADAENPLDVAVNLIMDSHSTPRVRITATIELDFCVQALVEREKAKGAANFIAREHTHVWWDGARWPCRLRLTSGRYASKYKSHDWSNATPTPDQLVAEMKRVGRELLNRTDAAKISGVVIFNSLDEAVPIGGVIKKIAGRELHLPTRGVKDTPQYPQVVAVHYDAQDAIIVATLSTEPPNALEAFG